MGKVRWGVLGAARIAVTKVIPAMQKGTLTEVTAIASRKLEKAREAAQTLGIPKWYGSYEELLADPDIDAVYNPLPNHLHVPWSIRAAEAGKHVLCEKPIAATSQEVLELIAARDRHGVKAGEAFMARTNPQWLYAQRLVDEGRLGDLRVMLGGFSYFNRDPGNIRNNPEWGGGALLDIGCYLVTLSRMLYRAEPQRVMALVERDPEFGVDRLVSGLMEYPGGGQCVFACGTQLAGYQRATLLGTKGRVEIEIPFNAPPDQPNRLWVDGELVEMPIADQYTIQGDLFSTAIRKDGPVPVPLEDALANVRAMEAMFRSAESGKWEGVVCN